MTGHRLAAVVAQLLPADHPDRDELLRLASDIDAAFRPGRSPSLWSAADDRLPRLRAAVLAAIRPTSDEDHS